MRTNKLIKYKEKTYLVTLDEYADRNVYRAWEQYARHASHVPHALKSSHFHGNYKYENDVWGNIATRYWPQEIEILNYRSEERVAAEKLFREDTEKLAYDLISSVFPEAKKYVRTNGEIIKKKLKVENDKKIIEHPDEIRDMLEGACIEEIQRLAKLNGVCFKEGDTNGLLKMRLMNVLRGKVKRKEFIHT